MHAAELRARLVAAAEGIERSIEAFRSEHLRDAATGRWLVDPPAPEEMRDNCGRPVLLDAYCRLASVYEALARIEAAAPVHVEVRNPAPQPVDESVAAVLARARRGEDATAMLDAIRHVLAQNGYVTGSDIGQAVMRAIITARQQHEASSHRGQMLDEARALLADVVTHERDVIAEPLLRRLRAFLSDPPEWDGVLRA